ncbi:hypothetical protein FPV25_03040 [Carnobacterium sp. PL17GRE32]|uniref:hypothetical protein n=1 Tax=Carnobacterium sp. PL17GRE32 TaxID=2592355 RepID=UPI0011EF4EC0|nr:hypothetical protein [Carnobacterium sp. PL17GRE32]KAF3306006.1 hypothetical protein FPV25_03040 [Carnobacterium sp. PL17GRE32]
METKSIDWIKEQRQQQIEISVKAYAESGDVVHLEDIEAINEHYDDVLLDLHATPIVHKSQNYS